jgi:hypothetical protein
MVARGLFNNSVRGLRLMLQSASNLRTLSKIVTRLSIRLAQQAVEREERDGQISRFAAPLGSARVFEGAFYPRSLIEDYIRLVPGSSITHAALAICGEAMRLYLEKHGELGDGSLTALLEVNVRNAGAHALVGNRIAINQVELHSSIIYPEGRLQAIYTAHRELHSVENEELTSFKLRSLYENLPAPLLSWLCRNANRQGSLNHRILEGGNLGLAELRGSEKPLYLLGAELRGFSSISPLYSGCGLMFCASTYADTFGLAFTSDRDMMPDPELMRACLDEAVDDLKKYLTTKAKRTRAGRGKPRRAAKSRRGKNLAA